MPASRPPRRRFAWIGALALAVGACLAPTLPVPPPSQPEVTAPDANGFVTLSGKAGSAQAGARIEACNESDGCQKGIWNDAQPDGSWKLDPLAAKSRDFVLVWQTIGNESSNPVELQVPGP